MMTPDDFDAALRDYERARDSWISSQCDPRLDVSHRRAELIAMATRGAEDAERVRASLHNIASTATAWATLRGEAPECSLIHTMVRQGLDAAQPQPHAHVWRARWIQSIERGEQRWEECDCGEKREYARPPADPSAEDDATVTTLLERLDRSRSIEFVSQVGAYLGSFSADELARLLRTRLLRPQSGEAK